MRSLKAASRARLQLYQRKIEGFAEEYGDSCWWLVAQSDYRMMAEEFQNILNAEIEKHELLVEEEKSLLSPFNPEMP